MKRRSFIVKALAGIAALPLLRSLTEVKPRVHTLTLVRTDRGNCIGYLDGVQVASSSPAWNPSMLSGCVMYFCADCGMLCCGDAIPHVCLNQNALVAHVPDTSLLPVAHYRGALSDSEMQVVHKYFGERYGI